MPAENVQLQLDGMEDPIYLDGGLVEVFSAARMIEAPEGDPSMAEYFFKIGKGTYELFRCSVEGQVFELDGPGFSGDVYVEGFPEGDKDARRICKIVLDYAAGTVSDGDYFVLESIAA